MYFRRLALSLALVLPVAACQPAGTPSPSFTVADSTAIRGLLTQYAATMVAQDWAAHVRYYSTDAVRMPPNEPVMRGQAAITAWDEALPRVTGFTLTPRVVAGDGNLAYASGAYTLDLAPRGAAPVNTVGKWQATYQRQADGSWLCVSDIWNADTPITPITTS